jgi:oligoribonuclease NrnB/cAMP/cGMP phosphodiesterase (DHH superfamily)
MPSAQEKIASLVGIQSGEEKSLLSVTPTALTSKVISSQTKVVDLVFYHGGGCPDGFSGAWAVYKKYGSKHTRYIPMNHGTPLATTVTGKTVVIVDYVFEAETMQKILTESKAVLVLDHHVKAQAVLENFPEENKYFDMHMSGATLAWTFFHPETPVPSFLRYVEDKDIWRWTMKNSKQFSAALNMLPQTFDQWDKLATDTGVFGLILKGKVILEYQDTLVARIAKQAVARRLKADPSYAVLVVNSPHFASEVGNVLSSREGVDVGFIWTYDHETQSIKGSFRSNSDAVDVNALAGKYGGGGHVRAAGFRFDSQNIEDIFVPLSA